MVLDLGDGALVDPISLVKSNPSPAFIARTLRVLGRAPCSDYTGAASALC